MTGTGSKLIFVVCHCKASGVGKASVAVDQWQRAFRAQDAVPRWHHARHLRAAGLHCPACRLGPQAQGQSDSIPWCVRPQQRASSAGDASQAGQGQPMPKERVRGNFRRPPRQSERLLSLHHLARRCLRRMTGHGRFPPIAPQHSWSVQRISPKSSERQKPTRNGPTPISFGCS